MRVIIIFFLVCIPFACKSNNKSDSNRLFQVLNWQILQPQKTIWSDLKVDGKFKANTWQGNEITAVQGEDGFKLTSPIGHYGLTASGLADMGGNVWNWCEDTFILYPGNADDLTADSQTKCMPGGSFFFDPALEKSFTVTFRVPNTAETSLFNIGFRCAANPK